jgi:hypothetical protein
LRPFHPTIPSTSIDGSIGKRNCILAMSDKAFCQIELKIRPSGTAALLTLRQDLSGRTGTFTRVQHESPNLTGEELAPFRSI